MMTVTTPISEDLRIRRTRSALKKALWELSSQKTFQSISVQDICSVAEVNRTTFYYHFPDKYALLEYSIRDEFKKTVQTEMPPDREWSIDNLRHLMLITWEAIDWFRAHCKLDNQREFAFVQSTLTEVLSEVLVQLFSKDNNIKVLEQSSVELAAVVTSWAIYGAGVYWSQEKRSEAAAVFIERVLPIIFDGLH